MRETHKILRQRCHHALQCYCCCCVQRTGNGYAPSLQPLQLSIQIYTRSSGGTAVRGDVALRRLAQFPPSRAIPSPSLSLLVHLFVRNVLYVTRSGHFKCILHACTRGMRILQCSLTIFTIYYLDTLLRPWSTAPSGRNEDK